MPVVSLTVAVLLLVGGWGWFGGLRDWIRILRAKFRGEGQQAQRERGCKNDVDFFHEIRRDNRTLSRLQEQRCWVLPR